MVSRKKLMCMVTALIAVFAVMTVPVQALANDEQNFVPNEVIIIYEPGYDPESAPVGAPAEGDEPAFGVSNVSDLGGSGEADDPLMDCLTLDLSEGTSLDEAIEQLEAMPGIAAVQKNYKYHVPEDDLPEGYGTEGLVVQGSSSDPKSQYQWHLYPWNFAPELYGWFGTNVREAWDLAKCDKKVTIAVLDTGCLIDHVDLKANIDTANMKDVYVGRKIGLMFDPSGHGTHVCGIAGAVMNNNIGVAGSSGNAKILPIKVFDDSGDSCDSETLCKAYDYLISRIKGGYLTDLHVINMSIGGYSYDDEWDDALQTKIRTMRDTYNVLTVCAGGNSAKTQTIWPGDFDECLSVTALDMSGNNTWFSDYNSYKDISAPGVDIYSTSTISSNSSYEWMSGTSMASPLVAGCAALLWAAVPNLSAKAAYNCICNTAHKLDPNGDYYHSNSGSAGGINAAAAVRYALQNYGAGTSRTPLSSSQVHASLDTTSYDYDGDAHTPSANVYFNGNIDGHATYRVLVEGTDYTMSYVENVSPGTALAILEGKGDYYGIKTLAFSINESSGNDGTLWTRLAGNNRYQTMSAIVSNAWEDEETGGRVIIATGEDFKDALAAAGFAGIYNCPVLITKKDELTPETAMLLEQLEPSSIYIAGGKAAVSDAVLDQIAEFTWNTYSDTPIEPRRLWGKNSCSTSAGIALEVSREWSDTAIIATNRTFKDALSAAPVSYAKHYPILLADRGDNLNEDVVKALDRCGIKKVIIVGGEKAVTPRVEKQLNDFGISRSNITRVAGDTAVETSKKIALWGLDHGLSADDMGFATSQNYPDALCGAAFVGKCRSVLLLADDASLSNASFPDPYRYDMYNGYVFGGESAVGFRTWTELVSNTRW